jgi:DNA-binding protein Fis
MSNKIENFVVKNKSGKINLKASISKFEKQLLKTIFPVSNNKILKVINACFRKSKGKKIKNLHDLVIMQLDSTPENQKYVRNCVNNFIKNNTGSNACLLGFSRKTGYWKWSK